MYLPAFFDGAAITPVVAKLCEAAPLRAVQTPYGAMSVEMTNCGRFGWTADRHGYRYAAIDPHSGRPWPAIPAEIATIATAAAHAAGFTDFVPDACLLNSYAADAKMGLHQDRDELDFRAPIVSLSLGCAAVFAVKPGIGKTGRAQLFTLNDGDAIVLGGEARLAYHGITRLTQTNHPLWQNRRLNLTLRTTGQSPDGSAAACLPSSSA